MSIQAAYYPIVALDSMRGVHASSSNPVYKLAFMHSDFKYNPRHEKWDQIFYREIQPVDGDPPNLLLTASLYPTGGYTIEIAATMIDGKFRLYPKNQSSITTLINFGLQKGWDFKSIVLYESKSGSLVFAFDAIETISGEYGGRFLKPRYLESKVEWNSGPPLVNSDQPPDADGTIDFLKELALPPYIYDGEVRAIYPGDDDSYYLAGTFTQVVEGRYAGRGAFDFVDPDLGSNRPERFRVSGGSVLDIIPDGTGGLFILGNFTQANQHQKFCIAKYGPDFEVNESWGVNVNICKTLGVNGSCSNEIPGTILTGAVTDEFLYVGGSFNILKNGSVFKNLVRFNIDTGNLDETWNPAPNLTVRTLAIHFEESEDEFNSAANKLLYIGGSFTSIKSKDPIATGYTTYSVKYLVRYNMGEFDDPPEIDLEWGPVPNLSVHKIITDESHVYVGGAFTNISGFNLRRIFRAHHITNYYRGLDASWSANWGPSSLSNSRFVRALERYGDYLFASARSDLIADADIRVKTLCAFSTIRSNQVLQFFPQVSNGGSFSQIWGMKVVDDKLYCVGTFQSIGPATRQGAACFDLKIIESPYLTNWAPTINRPGPGTSGELGISVIQPGPGPFCLYPTYSGVFFGASDLSPVSYRYGLCKINSDGKIDSWSPGFDTTPNYTCLERKGGFIYAGFTSDFSSPPGASKKSLVRISESTGQFSNTWRIGDESSVIFDYSPIITGDVYYLKIFEDNLYVGFSGKAGGYFDQNGRHQGGQNYLARFTIGEQITLDSWNPGFVATSRGFVNYIDVNENNVYATGKFFQVSNSLRQNWVSINSSTAIVNDVIGDLSPPISASGTGNRFPISHDDTGAYTVGSFTEIKRGSGAILEGYENNNYDIIKGLFCDGKIRTIISDGNGGFYVGGRFSKILGKPRSNIAHIDSSLQLTNWSPIINSLNGESIRKLFLHGNHLYVVGHFTKINNLKALRAARFHVNEGIPGNFDQNFVVNFSQIVLSVIADDNWVYFGLYDSVYRNSVRRLVSLNGSNIGNWRGVVRVNATTGSVDTQWICKLWFYLGSRNVNGFISDMDFSPNHDSIYVCGRYNQTRFSNTTSWNYGYATCINTPVQSSPATIQNWGVAIRAHPPRNIDYNRRTNPTGYIRSNDWPGIEYFKTLRSIKVYGNYVYLTGNPFLWGRNYHRSSRVARYPLIQNSSNLGFADPSFRLKMPSDPDRIVSLVNRSGTRKYIESSGYSGTDLRIDQNGDLHLCSRTTAVGIFDATTKRFTYIPHDGYLKIDSSDGTIKHYFDNKAHFPPFATCTISNNNIVMISLDSKTFDLKTSMVRIGEDHSLNKLFLNPDFEDFEDSGLLLDEDDNAIPDEPPLPPPVTGISDAKNDLLRVGDWMYGLSANNFDSTRTDQYFCAFDLKNGTDPVIRGNKLVSVAPSNAKSFAKVGNYIVIVGGEMPRGSLDGTSTNLGDFIDHGISGGRKVVYYKITESFEGGL
jgi:hypothetical protein